MVSTKKRMARGTTTTATATKLLLQPFNKQPLFQDNLGEPVSER